MEDYMNSFADSGEIKTMPLRLGLGQVRIVQQKHDPDRICTV
jgi:hypothetical protein